PGSVINGSLSSPLAPVSTVTQSAGPAPTAAPTGNVSPFSGHSGGITAWAAPAGESVTPALSPPSGSTSGLTEYRLPSAPNQPLDIPSGPDGNLWFTERYWTLSGLNIGRISTSGNIVEYPVPNQSEGNGITSGPDNNLWFTGGPNFVLGR